MASQDRQPSWPPPARITACTSRRTGERPGPLRTPPMAWETTTPPVWLCRAKLSTSRPGTVWRFRPTRERPGPTSTLVNSGLASGTVNGVFVTGTTIYAATNGGLSVSTNGGTSWTNYTTTNGLASNFTNGVWASGSTIWVGTGSGVSESTDGGTTWTTFTTANGQGSNLVNGIAAKGYRRRLRGH